MSSKDAPTVPKRNDPAALEPYAKSQATKAENQDPNFAYEWFREDQLELKLHRHEIGSQSTGYLMVEPWEHVTQDQGIALGRGPASDGKPLDTRVRKGDLWLCRTPKDNHAKYARIEHENDALIDRRLSGGQRADIGNDVSITTRTMGDNGRSVNLNKMLDGVA